MNRRNVVTVGTGLVIGTLTAVVINASIDDALLGLVGGLFIIFLWSRRP